jgi:hypothetical protein
MDSHIHESALLSSTTCCQSSANLATFSSGCSPLVTHLRQMLLDRLGRLKLLPHGPTPVGLIYYSSLNVATLALARDQGKGVARLRAYK